MVKTKNSVAKIVALMLVLALVIGMFALAMPKNTVQVQAATLTEAQKAERRKNPGLYETGTTNLIKSWDDMVADGTITVKGSYGDFRVQESLPACDFVVAPIDGLTNLSWAFGSGSDWSSERLTDIDITNWDTSNVTSMQFMFANCGNCRSLDLSSLNTSKVTNMRGMFFNYYCNKYEGDTYVGEESNESLDLSTLDTSNVTDMSGMFEGVKINNLDISSFDMSKVTDVSGMFDRATIGTLRGPKVCDKTFKDCALTFTSCSDYDKNSYSADDVIKAGASFGFNGNPAPAPKGTSVPSTGVLTNVVAIIIPVALVVAMAMVVRKKQRNF